MKKLILFAVAVLMLSGGTIMAQCPNLNLSYGNLTYWQCYHGSCASGNYTCVPTAPIPGNHTILSAAQLTAAGEMQDPACSVISKVPTGYAYSMLLGNNGTGAQVDAVSYKMTIDSTNDLLILSFAWVMENPGHSESDQPLFMMCIYDTNGHQLNLPCGCVNFVSSGNLNGLACNTSSLVAKDWTTVGFSLEPLIGQTIIIRYEVRDCTLSGHYGYAYLVAECRPMTIDLTYCEGQSAARLKAPEGFTSYNWSRSSQPNWHAYTKQINIQNPLDGEEFTCVITSELGCTSTLKTIIAKTSIDASFVFGVEYNNKHWVNIEDPNHMNHLGIFQSYYDTCSRTVTFVDMSTVVNSKKDNIIWEIEGTNFQSQDSLWTFTFPDPPTNKPLDYLVRLTVEAENGCADTSKAEVEHWIRIYPSPEVEIYGNDQICEGSEDSLYVNTVRSFFVDHEWTGVKESGGNVGPYHGESFGISGPGTYYVKSLDSVGCYAYDTFVVTPLKPQMPITQVNVLCNGEKTGQFTHGAITGAATIQNAYWTLKDVNGEDSIDYNSNVNGKTYRNLAAGKYTFYAIDAQGCELRMEVDITEPPLLESETSQEETTCGLDNGVVHVVPTGGTPPYSYVWKNSDGVNKGTSADARNLGVGWYYVTVTDANDCIRLDSVEVTALPYPIIYVDTIRIETCDSKNGAIAVHIDYAKAPITYTWTPNTGMVMDSIMVNIPAGTYTVKGVDANGCIADTTVTVGSYPSLKLSGKTTPETCGRSDGTIITTVVSGDPSTLKPYQWSGSPTDVSGETGDTVLNVKEGTYTVIVQDTYCLAQETFTVEHVDGPTANFEANSYSVASNTIFTLTDASKGTPKAWDWDMGDGNTSTGNIVYHTYENAGDYVVFMEVTDKNGCTDTISKIIHVYDELNVFIPNTFTPNGDGLNDTWGPLMTEYSENGYMLTIFDRWGQRIFMTEDPTVQWDGTVDGKYVAPNSIYTYRIVVRDYTGQEYEFVGHVTVLR